MEFKVMRQISGSYCVVYLSPDEYIDARKSVKAPGETFLEYVRGGQVRYHRRLPNETAPDVICTMMRDLAKGFWYGV